jgi:hypothetical protein
LRLWERISRNGSMNMTTSVLNRGSRMVKWSDTETLSSWRASKSFSQLGAPQPVYEGRFTQGNASDSDTQIMPTWFGHGLLAIDQYLRL